jgi:protocatechuate 3,4-dioxygenase beta subunit
LVFAAALWIVLWMRDVPARRTPDRTMPEDRVSQLPPSAARAENSSSESGDAPPDRRDRIIRISVLAAPDGKPIEGAEIRVTSDDADSRVRTGADGRAEIPTAKRGVVWVEAKKHGYIPAEATVIGGVDEASVVLVPAPIVRGRVVSAVDGKPIGGALVWVGDSVDEDRFGEELKTDGEGRFAAAVPALAPFRIGVAADGYGNVYRTGVGGERNKELDLRLGVGAVLRGIVRDPDGVPAPGVHVMLYPTDDDFLESYPRQALLGDTKLRRSARVTTDSEGRFVYRGIAAGRYTILAWGDELLTARVSPLDVADNERVRLTLTDSAGTWIYGPRIPYFTDRSGGALLGPLKPGRYVLRFEPPEALPAQRSITVAPGRIAAVEFEPRAGAALTGTVADESGRPLAGMMVEYQVVAAPGVTRHDRSTNTDRQGRFRFDGVQQVAGKLEVTDWADRYDDWSRPGVAPGPPVSVVLSRATRVTGRLVPPPRTRTIRYSLRTPRSQMTDEVLALDGAGRFVLYGVPAGVEVALCFDSGDAVPALRRLPPLAKGEERDLGTIQLAPGDSFRGRVRDRAGRPFAGIRVGVTVKECGIDRTVLTNEKGEFVFPNLPPGPVSVVFHVREGGGSGYELDDWTSKAIHELEVSR